MTPTQGSNFQPTPCSDLPSNFAQILTACAVWHGQESMSISERSVENLRRNLIKMLILATRCLNSGHGQNWDQTMARYRTIDPASESD